MFIELATSKRLRLAPEERKRKAASRSIVGSIALRWSADIAFIINL
ncbi:MAG: hypothetical protein QOH71_2543 [Blastocatellia bacterium]|jgi:hypothetical protein|nr:hypothetical protein [Blastocatellia bacterium]